MKVTSVGQNTDEQRAIADAMAGGSGEKGTDSELFNWGYECNCWILKIFPRRTLAKRLLTIILFGRSPLLVAVSTFSQYYTCSSAFRSELHIFCEVSICIYCSVLKILSSFSISTWGACLKLRSCINRNCWAGQDYKVSIGKYFSKRMRSFLTWLNAWRHGIIILYFTLFSLCIKFVKFILIFKISVLMQKLFRNLI